MRAVGVDRTTTSCSATVTLQLFRSLANTSRAGRDGVSNVRQGRGHSAITWARPARGRAGRVDQRVVATSWAASARRPCASLRPPIRRVTLIGALAASAKRGCADRRAPHGTDARVVARVVELIYRTLAFSSTSSEVSQYLQPTCRLLQKRAASPAPLHRACHPVATAQVNGSISTPRRSQGWALAPTPQTATSSQRDQNRTCSSAFSAHESRESASNSDPLAIRRCRRRPRSRDVAAWAPCRDPRRARHTDRAL